MKIAFCHNLQVTESEEEAEFDPPDTIAVMAESLRRLGHELELVEVSGPASRVVARLEAANPDLVFNIAEGRRGRSREAFYPGLFEQLGYPYTGSDSYVCSLTLDKHLTKMIISGLGVLTPPWVFIEKINGSTIPDFKYPVLVKPNFEGASKGITLDSIIETPVDLMPKVEQLLERYPEGVLVEEYIEGRDIIVPFLEYAQATNGVLASYEYSFNQKIIGYRKYQIYDYSLRHLAPEAVAVKVPAAIGGDAADQVRVTSEKIIKALGIHDLGSLDYRLTPDNRLFFLEGNVLPRLRATSGLFLAAQLAGFSGVDAVLDMVIRSAAKRHNIEHKLAIRRPVRKAMRVGLTYNLKRVAPKQVDDDDSEAEYDSQSTVDAIHSAIASHGHEVVPLEATGDLPVILASSGLDVVFNIAEGIHGRNREAQVPALLELLGIPYTGSDPATLSLALDKVLAKRIVKQAGLLTPEFMVMHTGKERLPKELKFPVIVKPIAEGSSKGVFGISVAENEQELRDIASMLLGKYRQDALVEEFLTGREFTVALLGERRPKVFAPMEIVFLKQDTRFPVYAFEHKLQWNEAVRYDVPANVDPVLAREIEKAARGVFFALGCRDVARVDLRLDGAGRVNFIEVNPLPGLTPGWSDLCLITENSGMDYRTLIGEILAPAIRRFRMLNKEKGILPLR